MHVESDPVVGGTYRILECTEGDQVDHVGRYLVAEPPHRLHFTLDVPQQFSESTEIRVLIVSDGDGTRLEFSRTGIDPAKARPFEQLESAAVKQNELP